MSLAMTNDEVVTELLMTSSSEMNFILEGDDDYKFFSSALENTDKVNLICAWGSDNVTDIIKKIDIISNNEKITPTLGVIDRDYRIPLKNMPSSPNLLYTDLRDIECMMFQSRSFDAVISEMASKGKLEKFGGCCAARNAIASSAKIIGEIRYYSQYKSLGISFQDLKIDSIICKKTLNIKQLELIDHINKRQGKTGQQIGKEDQNLIISTVNSAKCFSGNMYFTDPMLLCRGHDLMEIFAIAFRSLLGSKSSTESTKEKIEQLFRLNYIIHFKNSNLARNISEWMKKHRLDIKFCFI